MPTAKPISLDMNHAMIYSRDVEKSLAFYRGQLGFELLEEYRGGDTLFYARLRVPGSAATVALHVVHPGDPMHPGGVRLYFEVKRLEWFCDKLAAAGVVFSKMPEMMPWGWKHAYLNDPDGHELSLYRAGTKRLKKAKGVK